MISTLQEIYRDMKNGVYDYTKDGECVGCGQCCSALLPLSRKEIRDILRYVKKHKLKPHHHGYGAPIANMSDFDMICPFRDDVNHKCDIYHSGVKPMICESFRCDKPSKRIEADRKTISKDRQVVNMWSFFV